MSACHEAIYTAVEAIWSGDANGLGNGVAEAKVRTGDFQRRGDKRKVAGVPAVIVDIQDQHDSSFDINGHEVLVTFNIISNRDRGFAVQNAIEAGIYAKYHQRELTATGWSLGRACRLGGSVQMPGDAERLHLAIRLLIHAKADTTYLEGG